MTLATTITDITNYVASFLPFIVTFALPFLIPLFRDLYLWLQQTLAMNKHSLLLQAATIAVHSIEQIMTTSDSVAKKKAAVNCVEDILREYNLSVNPAVVDALIESIVHEMNATQSKTTV